MFILKTQNIERKKERKAFIYPENCAILRKIAFFLHFFRKTFGAYYEK